MALSFFDRVEKIVEKGENIAFQNFLLFKQYFPRPSFRWPLKLVFYPFGELSAIFIKFKIVVCRLFQFGSVKNLSFGKELNCIIKDMCGTLNQITELMSFI